MHHNTPETKQHSKQSPQPGESASKKAKVRNSRSRMHIDYLQSEEKKDLPLGQCKSAHERPWQNLMNLATNCSLIRLILRFLPPWLVPVSKLWEIVRRKDNLDQRWNVFFVIEKITDEFFLNNLWWIVINVESCSSRTPVHHVKRKYEYVYEIKSICDLWTWGLGSLIVCTSVKLATLNTKNIYKMS